MKQAVASGFPLALSQPALADALSRRDGGTARSKILGH